ncbi:hypothetical protein [Nitrincola sp. A-D6]|uniref:hypothetical protein n=1 Tax=Nitrincola sp. A-D6 TaxID=1545442 RepID=UPI00190F9451|nr:hypothetical protein [Nitrincola sp. A-D6]
MALMNVSGLTVDTRLKAVDLVVQPGEMLGLIGLMVRVKPLCCIVWRVLNPAREIFNCTTPHLTGCRYSSGQDR